MQLKVTALWAAITLTAVAIGLAFLAVSSHNTTGAWAGLCVVGLSALGAWLTFVQVCNRLAAARQAHRLERKIDALRQEIATRAGFQQARCDNCALRQPGLRVIAGG